MRLFGILAAALVLAAPALALQTGPAPGDRVAIVVAEQPPASWEDRTAHKYIPRYFEDELKKQGFQAHILEMSIDDLRVGTRAERHPADFYVEVVDSLASGRPVIGGGGGGVVGTTVVGASVDVVTALGETEIRVYDGRTLELSDSFVISARDTSPYLSGVSLGGRHAFLSVPFFWNQPYKKIARDLARLAVLRLQSPERADELASGDPSLER